MKRDPLPLLPYDHGGVDVAEFEDPLFADAQWFAVADPYFRDPKRERVVRSWQDTERSPL